MLTGKIIRDGNDYSVKVGSVIVDISEDVRDLIAREIVQACSQSEQELVDLRAKHADVNERYSQIQRIVLAGGAGMPTG